MNKIHTYRIIIVAVVVLLVIGLFLLFAANNGSEINSSETSEKIAFTINNTDIQQSPVLQDFTDNGWEIAGEIEQTGTSSDGETVPSVLYTTGYRMESGECYINVYLLTDDVESGLDADACRVRSISFYGENVESFCIDGQEYVGINQETLLEIMGEPDDVQENAQGSAEISLTTYSYSIPERNISSIYFNFLSSSDIVGQILVYFELY